MQYAVTQHLTAVKGGIMSARRPSRWETGPRKLLGVPPCGKAASGSARIKSHNLNLGTGWKVF